MNTVEQLVHNFDAEQSRYRDGMALPDEERSTLRRINERAAQLISEPHALGDRVVVFAMRSPADLLVLLDRDPRARWTASIVARTRKLRSRWTAEPESRSPEEAIAAEVVRDLHLWCDDILKHLADARGGTISPDAILVFCPFHLVSATPTFHLPGDHDWCTRRGIISRFGHYLAPPNAEVLGFVEEHL